MNTLLAVALLAAGYGLGRWRPAPRLLSWAEDAAHRSCRHPAWWAAQVVFAVALAWIWIVHPRRAAANRRSWRQDHTVPASSSIPTGRTGPEESSSERRRP